jgi:glycosyltransferase involved in cell wall biosynthesis
MQQNTQAALDELPPPPPGKTGWPWTEPSPHPVCTVLDNPSWPRISIVTPSYNQGEYIEEAIRSILLQNYPNTEYIVIDGGSTDHSTEVIQKYGPWLTHWVSEPDRGQAHAINKGFALCTGDLVGWINSDDGLLPGGLATLAAAFRHSPTSILLGDVLNIDEVYEHTWLRQQKNVTFEALAQPGHHNAFWQQPGTFWPRALYLQIGDMDESLRYLFDLDWMCRALQVAPVHYLRTAIALFRLHDTSKTVHESAMWDSERCVVAERYWGQDGGSRKLRAALSMHLAANRLRVLGWNRSGALKHLRDAIGQRWLTVSMPKFWGLCIKAALPPRLLESLRALRSRFTPGSCPHDTEGV